MIVIMSTVPLISVSPFRYDFMLAYCYKCFTPHRFDNVIPTGGKRLQCNECGYEYTLFPSKVIIGEFRDYVIYHTDLSSRALSTILQNVSSVNQFFQLTRRDFLNFRNCGLKTANELTAFKKTLHKNLGYMPNEKESKIQSDMTAIPFFLNNNSEFFETIMHELSPKNYDLFANKYQIDSLEKFMALKIENLISIKKEKKQSDFMDLLANLRSNSENAPTLDEITAEVESVRSKRYED